MKIPRRPPDLADIEKKLLNDRERFQRVKHEAMLTEADGKYRHWDILRHIKPPETLSAEEWWYGIKALRMASMKQIPLFDTKGACFSYTIPDRIAEELHGIDLGAGGAIGTFAPIINTQTRDQYVSRSLIQEAITSSQLEGAATTRKVAKEMIRSGRRPRNRSEQMILNNYSTMQEIRNLKEHPLTEEMVFTIHKLVTENTLDNQDAAGRLRKDDEEVLIEEVATGEILHTPPHAKELPERLKAMCAFANGETPKQFLHPVIRGILLHFWIGYDHPFVDGNGRTARAIFYWSMLRHGYWLFEFISISEILLKAPIQYALAYLHTETDGNDLTYFILHQSRVIQRAVQSLHQYIAIKTEELVEVETLMKSGVHFNFRQQDILAHALHSPGAYYTIEAHKNIHQISYETARKDLQQLCSSQLLDMRKKGKGFVFIAPQNLGKILKEFNH